MTCILHLLHNCAMKLRNHYRYTNGFIYSVKGIIVKSTTAINMFTEIGIPLEPILTRRGAWLKAIEYYQENFPRQRNCWKSSLIKKNNWRMRKRFCEVIILS